MDEAQLIAEFTGFAAREGKGYSPLYERLAEIAAADPDIWGLLASAPAGFRKATLFFAALQHAVAAYPGEALAAWFPIVTGGPVPDADPAEPFTRFCVAHAARLAELIATHRTQTNEVGRSAALLLALAQAGGDGPVQAGPSAPIGLVELGASAGLNLLLDAFCYEYTTADGVHAVGDPGSPVLVRAELRGSGRVPEVVPVIGSRIGVDIAPVDVMDEEAVAWLRACVFADQAERRARLAGAVGLARLHRPDVRRGVLPELAVLDSVPLAHRLCLMSSWALPYLAEDARRALVDNVLERSEDRLISWVTMEPAGAMPFPDGRAVEYSGAPPTVLAVSRFADGTQTDTVLAVTHPHGAWIEWAD